MKRYILIFLLVAAGAFAQGTGSFTNPIPGWVFTYQGPTLDAEYAPIPDNVSTNVKQAGAVCNGSADDRAMLNTLDNNANVVELLITGTCRVASNLTLNKRIAFIAGALKPDSGVTITVNGRIRAFQDDIIFDITSFGTVVTPNAPWVSVAWWGALAAARANTDAMPGIRAALGNNRTIFFPPATYTCKSFDTNPYPLVFGPICLTINGYNHFTIMGYGAKITADNTHNNSNMIETTNASFFQIFGLELVMNATGLPISAGPNGLIFTTVNDFIVADVSWTGNWGGLTRHPTAIGGDWFARGWFTRLNMPTMSECFDIAFVSHISITHVKAQGADDAGAIGNYTQLACINIQNDAAMLTNYPAQASVTTTDTVQISDNDFGNFKNGIYLTAGTNYTIRGNVFRSNQLGGVWIAYTSGGNTDTGNSPVQGFTISDNLFINNGAIVNNAALVFDSTSAVSSRYTGYGIVSGNVFINNKSIAIDAVSLNLLTSIIIGDNAIPLNATQVTPITDNILQLNPGMKLHNDSVSMTNGSTFQLPLARGQWSFINPTNGDIGAFLVGGGGVVRLGSSMGTFVASAAPAGGQIGVYYDGAAFKYTVKNNFGSTVQLGMFVESAGSQN